MLDLDPDQQEVDLSDDHVFEVVPDGNKPIRSRDSVLVSEAVGVLMTMMPLLLGLVVFKLNVQAVLDPHLHLD